MSGAMGKAGGLVLAVFVLLQSCVSAPRPDDPVAACGLDPREGWVPMAREPLESDLLLAATRHATSSRSAQDQLTPVVAWFATADTKRLAYCAYQGDRTCGVSVTSIFHPDLDTWVPDDEEIVQICSRH